MAVSIPSFGMAGGSPQPAMNAADVLAAMGQSRRSSRSAARSRASTPAGTLAWPAPTPAGLAGQLAALARTGSWSYVPWQATSPYAAVSNVNALARIREAGLTADAARDVARLRGQADVWSSYFPAAAGLLAAPYRPAADMYSALAQARAAQNIAQLNNEARMWGLATILNQLGPILGSVQPVGIQTSYGAGVSF